MTENQSRAEPIKDRIVEEVVDKVDARPSVGAPREEIAARAEESVEELVDRPVQTFTPLLAENQVVSGLMDAKRARRSGGEDDGRDGDGGDNEKPSS